MVMHEVVLLLVRKKGFTIIVGETLMAKSYASNRELNGTTSLSAFA